MRTVASLLDGKRARAVRVHARRHAVRAGGRHRVPPRRSAAWPASSGRAACSRRRGWTRTRRFRSATATAIASACSPSMDRAPLADVALAEAVLKIIGSRIAAELERSTTEGVLRAAALAVSSARGSAVFAELARSLAEILRVDIAFIARPDADEPRHDEGARDAARRRAGRRRRVRDRRARPAKACCSDGFRVVTEARRRALPRRRDAARATRIEGYAGYPLHGPRRRDRSAWSRSRRVRRCGTSTGSSR